MSGPLSLFALLVLIPIAAFPDKVEPCAYLGDSIKTYEVPDGVDFIGEGAFAGSALREIRISEGVVAIGDYAFSGCKGLKSVSLSSSLKYIGRGAFAGCSSLEELEIPTGVEVIGDEAFRGAALRCFVSPVDSRLNSLGVMAFAGCSLLEAVILPYGLSEIGGSAFFGCERLSAIVLPGSLKEIPELMLAGDSSISDLTLPGRLRSIGTAAMDGCSGLRRIDAVDVDRMPLPGDDVWHGVAADRVSLYIPSALEADYKSDSQWSRFNIISGTTGNDYVSMDMKIPLSIEIEGDNVRIISSEAMKLLKVYTIDGKMTLTQSIEGKSVSLSLPEHSGVLLFSVLLENGRLVTIKKIIY